MRTNSDSEAARRAHAQPYTKADAFRRLRELVRSGHSPRFRLLVALAAGLVPVVLQYSLSPAVVAPFLLLFLSLSVVAVVAGRWPALITLALLAVAGNYYFLNPPRTFSLEMPATGATALFLTAGLALIWLLTLRERAERKLTAELELSRGTADHIKRQFDAVFGSMVDGVLVFDMQGRVVLVNDAEARISGDSLGVSLMQDLSYFAKISDMRTLDGQRIEPVDWPAARILRGETIDNEAVRVRRFDSGREWCFSISGRPIVDHEGKQIYATLIARDISDQQRMIEALRQSEQRFRQLADSMPHLVWTAGPDGALEYYNERYREFSGIEHDQSAGWMWSGMLHPEDRDRTLRAWQNALRTGDTYEIEHRGRLHDGSYRWFLSRALPARDEHGRVLRWYGTATDIDAQKRAEDALRDVDRRKDQFLAMLGHELRNPLAPIHNGLFILDHAAPGGEQANRAKAIISRQVVHLSRLVDDLLDVSRVSRDKIELHRERLELSELVRRTVDDHRAEFERAGVSIHVKTPDAPLWLSGDRTRLSQVFGNLLTNAAKFTPAGGRTDITVEHDAQHDQAVVHVRDTGTGISAEMRPRLFQPFMQADTSLVRSHGGLGLGLTLIKGLVELHGGSVSEDSPGSGKGALFTVRLPAQAIEKLVQPQAPALEERHTRKRVLVIEDNEDAAETLREALELNAHVVQVAGAGPSGLQLAHDWRPDAVLCDIGLPGMDGYEVARRMRIDPGLHDVCLIALSGYAQPEDVARAKAAGFDRHIKKPPDLDEIEGVLASTQPST